MTTPDLTPDGAWPELEWSDDLSGGHVATISAGRSAGRMEIHVIAYWRPHSRAWHAWLAGSISMPMSKGATPAEALAPVRAELRRIIAALTEANP